MKKTNNKFRNNNNSNQIYSLNYKFDSISVAGKISGTALDLIKKYNELAKEAHGNNDYVTAEIFRQYAEHYRKIVTEINEKKNAQKIVSFQKSNETQPVQDDNVVSNDNLGEDSKNPLCNNSEESGNSSVKELSDSSDNAPVETLSAPIPEKKEFKVIEISSAEAGKLVSESEASPKPRAKRMPRKKEVVAV